MFKGETYMICLRYTEACPLIIYFPPYKPNYDLNSKFPKDEFPIHPAKGSNGIMETLVYIHKHNYAFGKQT